MHRFTVSDSEHNCTDVHFLRGPWPIGAAESSLTLWAPTTLKPPLVRVVCGLPLMGQQGDAGNKLAFLTLD